MRTLSLLALVLCLAPGCSSYLTGPPDLPEPQSPMSVRGLSLTLASVKDAVNHRVPQAVLSIVDPETQAEGDAMAETLMTIADGSPEFVDALMAATPADLIGDGSTHTFRYAEEATGDDSGFSLVVLIDFRLADDGTAYLHAVRAAG